MAETMQEPKVRRGNAGWAEMQPGSRLLLRRSTWCGIVFALGVLLTTLNLLPPVGVGYRFMSQIVLSETRLQTLQENIKNTTRREQSIGAAAILRLNVLDRGVGERFDAKQVAEKRLVLVEIHSAWPNLCSEQAYSQWLEGLARPAEESFKEKKTTEAAEAVRFARWERATLEHYQSRNIRLDASGAAVEAPMAARPASNGRVFELAASQVGTAPTAKLASQHRSTASLKANAERRVQAEMALQSRLEAAQRQVQETELALERQIEQSSGELHITGGRMIQPMTSTIPMWMAASVLILGLAAGSSAGWIQYRWQAGGAYDAATVARQLAVYGIPLAGEVDLAGERLDASDWMGQARRRTGQWNRRFSQRFVQVSEAIVGFWFLIILIRAICDPLWRGLLIDSPLAAFGRLISGMP